MSPLSIPGKSLSRSAVSLYLAAGKPDRFITRLEDYWKDTKVSQINAGAIRQSAIEIYPECSGATRNRQVIVVTQAIINHCAELQLCQHLRMKRFKVESEIKKPVTKEWLDSFVKHATRPDVSALAMFMFATGARISEALSVSWADLDFQKWRDKCTHQKISKRRLSEKLAIDAVSIHDGLKTER